MVAGMRRPRLCLVALFACLAGTLAASAAATRPLNVTFVGDSVSASIEYVPAAEELLESNGIRVRLDLKVCRRLVQASCPYHGSTPPTALDAVRGYGGSLGAVLIVKVGYNESSYGYRDGIDRVMRAALADGAQGVVWVTLRETNDVYRGTNAAIRSAATRWPQLVLADWNA